MTPTTDRNPPPGWMIWIALWIVYIVWGSTYLAIRVTVETMPPLLTAGVRFMAAGAITLVFLRLKRGRGSVRVTGRGLYAAAIVGAALLLGGNGMVSIAEQYVPSGLTALIIASVPLWVVVLRKLFREPVPRATLLGVGAGFVGVAILVSPGSEGSDGASLAMMLLVVLASVSWASGSFFSKKLPLPDDPFVSTMAQMLAGGALMSLVGIARGELNGLDPSSFSAASLWAFVYLVVAGSLLAFTAYVWLLKNAPISKVATYAYVNPVVAIALGWLILSETVTPLIIVGASIIVASVAAIVRIESVVAQRAARLKTGEPGGAPSPDIDVTEEPQLSKAASPTG
ncbi:MAG: EamA family transporter [Actinomycetota bacterium]